MRWGPILVFFLVGCASQSPVVVKENAVPAKRTVKAKVVQDKAAEKSQPDPVNHALIERLRDRNVVIVDVRSMEEYVNGHVVGARNIDFLNDGFEAKIKKLDSTKSYYLYCASGNRAGKALRYFLARGLKASTLSPYEELKTQGLPLEGLSP
jgi:phage shock protein E